MSDEKIDIEELARQVAYEKEYAGDSEFMDSVLALVRAVRASIAHLRHLEEDGECKDLVTMPDGNVECRIVEELSAALAAFTDSADSAESASGVRSDGE